MAKTKLSVLKQRNFWFTWLSITTFILIFFQFKGSQIENGIRNYYRENICHCDTLRQKFILDKTGVPKVNYFSLSGEHIGIQDNPLEVCQYAQKYLIDIDKDYEKFWSCVSWLTKNVSIKKNDSIEFANYLYKYPWKEHGMKKGWKSAMTNAFAMGVFIDAYGLNHNDSLLFITKKLLNSFDITVEQGGVSYKSDIGYWYEEYADPKGDKPHVLNGMMHAILGLRKYNQLFKDSCSERLVQLGINALCNTIANYDRDDKSYYDLNGHIATWRYHELHIALLKEILKFSNEQELIYYYKKWGSQTPKSFLFSRIKQPNLSFLVMLSIGLGTSLLIAFLVTFKFR